MLFDKFKSYNQELKFLFKNSKDIHFVFFLSLVLILILAFLETTIVGSVIPIVDLLLDKEKFISYQILINEKLDLGLIYEEFVKFFFIFIFLIFIFSSIIQLSTVFFSALIREKISFKLRNLIINNYLNLKKNRYFIESKVGDLTQKLLVHTLNSASVIWELMLILRNFIVSLFIYILLLIISLKITIYLTLFFIFLGIIFLQLGRKVIIKKTHLRNFHQSEIFTLSNVILSSIKIIRIFNREKFFSKKFFEETLNYKNKETLLQTSFNLPGILIKLIFVIISLLTLFYLLNINNFSLINLSFYAVYIGAAYKLINLFAEINNRFYSVMNFLPSISIVMREIEISNDNSHEKDFSKKICLISFNKSLKLNNISFGHQKNKNNLSNINFEIKKYSITSILGPSGSGKSTLLDIICGFSKKNDGNFKIDSNKVFESDQIDFSKISYSNQDQIIFAGSIEENITFFENKEDLNTKKINEVVDICEVREILDRNKISLDHRLNEKGLELSGGEKQRINLARAIYLSNGFLVLDEPLTNVQRTLEEQIMSRIIDYTRMSKTTLLIVSHSLKSVSSADQIIILKNGKVSDIGIHNDLLKNNSYYKNNYNL